MPAGPPEIVFLPMPAGPRINSFLLNPAGTPENLFSGVADATELFYGPYYNISGRIESKHASRVSLVIAAVAKAAPGRRLWLVARVNAKLL